jgi:hypothetical protein
VLSNNGNLAGGGKKGYKFATGAGTIVGAVNSGNTVVATPLSIDQAGIRSFCAEEDAVARVDPAGACSNAEAILPFNPLNHEDGSGEYPGGYRPFRAASSHSLLFVSSALLSTSRKHSAFLIETANPSSI